MNQVCIWNQQMGSTLLSSNGTTGTSYKALKKKKSAQEIVWDNGTAVFKTSLGFKENS